MCNKEDDFDWDAYEKAVKEHPLYPAEQCYRHIEEVMESDIIRLYDSIDHFLFQDNSELRIKHLSFHPSSFSE